jgi:hypothetical protein
LTGLQAGDHCRREKTDPNKIIPENASPRALQMLYIYHDAADTVICAATLSIAKILRPPGGD